MILNDITMVQFEEGLKRTRTAILPVGSVEEHGAHLPLGTDTFQICETARLTAEQIPVFVCPPLNYGYCRSTRDHPGTISVSPSSVRSIVFDIGMDLCRQGIRGLIIASGHAGGLHMAALEEAGEKLAESSELEVAVINEYRWAQEAKAKNLIDTPNDGHAGEIETSRILSLRPELVKGTSPEEYPNLPAPFIGKEKRQYWPGGVWGNPAAATPEKGLNIYAFSVDKMVGLVKEMQSRIKKPQINS